MPTQSTGTRAPKTDTKTRRSGSTTGVAAVGGKPGLRRRLPDLYSASASKVTTVNVPAMRFLMIDGSGDPNSAPAFREGVEALYAVAYTLKFLVKRRGGAEFAVMPLEGLWWADDMAHFVERYGDKSGWKWTLMIAQPDVVTPELLEEACRSVRTKKELQAVDRIRLEAFREGPAAQTLHVGPYAEERPTIERLHRAIAESGGTLTGKHHEIYLGDPRRAAPEKLRTIVRQPFAPATSDA